MGARMRTKRLAAALAMVAALCGGQAGCAVGSGGPSALDAGRRAEAREAARIVVGAGAAESPRFRARVRVIAR